MENKKEFKLDKARFWIILILVLIGIGLCIELGYIFYKTNFLTDFVPSFCSVSEQIDCDGVAQTKYALSMGVPNALWGLILYLVILMLLFVDKIQAKFKNTIFDVFENPRSYISFLGILSFAISMVLAFISIFEIKKICQLCFCTYFINLFIALTANTKGFFLHDAIVTVIDFVKGAKKYFILFLIVLIGFCSTLYYLNDSVIFSPKLKQQKEYEERQKENQEFLQAKENKYAVKENILGKKDAKVVIKLYSDYNCPFCRVMNIMLHKASKSQKILVEKISFPLDTTCNPHIGHTLGGHEFSCIQARYALAAKKQDAFWGVANIMYDKSPKTFEDFVREGNKANLKIDYEKLKNDANSPEIIKELDNEIQQAIERGVSATPSFEINGTLYVGAKPYSELIEKIKLEEKRTQNK